MPDPEKIVNQRKTSLKRAPRSGKPKKSYVSLEEKTIAENRQFEDLKFSIVSEEIPSEIHKAPCSFSSPLDRSPKKISHTVHHILLSLSSIS